MSKQSKPMAGAENFPTDCLQLIFNHLNDADMRTVSIACKDFLAISNLSKQSLKVIHPKVSMLSAHLNRFRDLKKIDLSDFGGDIDEAIVEIACSGLDLEALDISCQIKSLTELGSNSVMKNLKVLNFHSLDRLQKTNLVVIANSVPNLEELSIGHNYCYYSREESWGEVSSPQFPTDTGARFLASKLRFLKKLHISGKNSVSDRSLVDFSLNCVFLKDVKISVCKYGVTENGIGLLLRNRPNLEALSIGYVRMGSSESTITIENSISHAKSLTCLEFSRMVVSDMLLNAIASAKLRLRKFGLEFCKNFTAPGLIMVLTNDLTELRIVGAKIADADMEFLLNGDVTKLSHVEISNCHVTDSTFFLLLTKCPSLVDIRMNPTDMNGQVVNGDNVIQLSENHKIRNLCLHYRLIRHKLIQQLGLTFPNLTVLGLSFYFKTRFKVVEAILKSFKSLTKLKLVGNSEANVIEADDPELPEVNLEDITLSGSGINDEGLAAIARKCPRLSSLSLKFCMNLTAEGIKQFLKNNTTLNCLHMIHCDAINHGDLLGWMLSTGNLASLKKIDVGVKYDISEEQRDEFLHHGCLLLNWSPISWQMERRMG